ncbi:alpha/beta hydrolase [Agromyces intestinalis]|uniref:Alpha/beta hydrolase n=1 Tax=Agromyces intestinalis TaxID=2592652 RepID=A0A5C1Y9Z5_9MICO|nr:alpha/beta hydrolase [Agromyces intestinalis]QEO13013.1 alpha/beta hydrolase [Agromyces intestinalis]
MHPTRTTIDLSGGPVSYLSWRPDAAPRSTILLLHGGGVDDASLSWGALAPRLARAGHRVIAPDHPGFGESPLPSWTVTQERLVDYVGEFADAVGLDRCIIGGLSLGGGMTIGHALARPDRVTGVLLFATYGLMDRQVDGVFGASAHALTWLMLRTGLLDVAQRAYARDRRLLARGMREIVRDPGQLTDELLDEVEVAARRPGSGTAFGQWQRDQFGWRRLRTNYASQAGQLRSPVLVVHGDRDSGVPLAVIERAAAGMPDARLLVVPGAGHWVQRDRPDLVATAVVDFLDELEGGPDASSAHP